MNKVFKALVSEQIPNDGGWHWNRLIKEANERLGKIGKRGKRAKIKVTPKPGKPISAQFSLPGVGQKQYGLDLPLDRNNLIKAEEYCTSITNQLVVGMYTEEWFNSLIGKKHKNEQQEQEKVLTGKEMLEQYKAHFFKQRKNNKSPNTSWYLYYRYIEAVLIKTNTSINLKVIKEIIEQTENDTLTRTNHLNGLANLLKYHDNIEFKEVIKRYKAENNPKPKKKYIPDDGEIINVYNYGFEISKYASKNNYHRYPQWRFLYSLLATYGLRVHEAWNIKNWHKPVTLTDGDWIAVVDDDEDVNNENDEAKYYWQKYQGKTTTIPAILDPNNESYLLCIGHETKTGYRVAFPLSPSGHDWIKEFNLIQPLNLPDIPNPLKQTGTKQNNSINCTIQAGRWFRTKKYGFTPHALRHAYNIRGHKLGIRQKTLADSLGHGLQMNSSTYLRHENDRSKLQGIKQAISEDKLKRSELDRLRTENEQLKAENEKLRTENAMYKTLLESQESNR